MLNLLGIFSDFKEDLKWLLIGIAIVVIIIALIKYPNARVYVFSMAIIAVVAFTIYAGIQLNYYYTASGGIYGKLVSIYNPNQVTITDNVKYSFKNIELVKDGEIYSAKITSDEVLDVNLDEEATYGVYINGMPCTSVEITNDYVIADYGYVFYDEDFNVLMVDTLTLRFAFYTNSTYLSVSTSGGSEAVKYWNYFFNKNTFEVTIDTNGQDYSSDSNFTSGDISNYSVVTFYVDNEVYLKRVYQNGSTIDLPDIENVEWSIDNQIINSNYVVTSNVEVYGLDYRYSLLINPNGGTWNGSTNSQVVKGVYGSTMVIEPPTRTGYVFTGWTLSVGASFNSSTNVYTFYSNLATMTATWSSSSGGITPPGGAGVM